jgi:hypothetical protein
MLNRYSFLTTTAELILKSSIMQSIGDSRYQLRAFLYFSVTSFHCIGITDTIYSYSHQRQAGGGMKWVIKEVKEQKLLLCQVV